MTLGTRVISYGSLCLGAMLTVGLVGRWAGAQEAQALLFWVTALVGSVAIAITTFLLWRAVNGGIKGMVTEISSHIDSVASGVKQVSNMTSILAQGTAQQAEMIADTSKSMEEMILVTKRHAENSRSTTKLVEMVNSSVSSANHSLKEMAESMQQIGESSEKVAKIIKVIDEIAFQTNILSLNAAVEAARAGEAGVGFAVVADEVRSLAQRSAQAARDTTNLIEESIARANGGSTRLEQVTVFIRSITDNALEVRRLVDEASAGSQEQLASVDHLAKILAEVQTSAGEAAEQASQSVAASEWMESRVKTLLDSVAVLQTTLGDKNTSTN